VWPVVSIPAKNSAAISGTISWSVSGLPADPTPSPVKLAFATASKSISLHCPPPPPREMKLRSSPKL